MVRGKILLAEDDEEVGPVLAASLRRAGFNVVEAHTAKQAVDLLTDSKLDVLLTDVWLPDDHQLSYLEGALDPDPTFAVVVMTGHASLDTAVRALRTGAIDYLEKPVSTRALIAVLDRAVHAAHASRAAVELRELANTMQRRMQRLNTTLHAPRPTGAPDETTPAKDRVRVAGLSTRETEIVGRLNEGQSMNEAAQALQISVHTARNHLKSAFKKLGVHSQGELLDLVRAD